MNTLIHYARIEKNKPIAVFVADEEDGHVSICFAVCNPKDKFDKKLGKTIALGRAKHYDRNDKIVIPQRVAPYFFHFLEQCIARPSFQGKTFPKWLGESTTLSPVKSKRFPNILVDLPKAWDQNV